MKGPLEYLAVLSAVLGSAAFAGPSPHRSLPTVDLGYAVHRATLNDSSFPYYNFSNIRYAAAPLGDLRFAAPIPPTTTDRSVNDGQSAVICPQAYPAWLDIQALFLSGVPLAELANLTASDFPIPPTDPRTSEDCLFLDVFVPTKIFHAKDSWPRSRGSSGAAVMVWIYGGGYNAGDKTHFGNPATLLATAQQQHGQEGVIYVAMNYRLGLFGFLNGPTFQATGTANAGFWDQRLALEWVQAHIHRFGGDAGRVTVFGESAGAGSIVHQITAFAGLRGRAPFQQAILQSPAWQNIPGNAQAEAAFQQVLETASAQAQRPITTLAGLGSLSTTQLQSINAAVVANSAYGTFAISPAVDGFFVPALPGLLLLHGHFDASIRLLLGHTSDEGRLFTDPFAVATPAQFAAHTRRLFPAASAAAIHLIDTVLYPALFDGRHGYTTPVARAALLLADSSFTCNARYLHRAVRGHSYAYLFAIAPGLHGQDVAYTYFNGDTLNTEGGGGGAAASLFAPVNASLARGFQGYLTSFAQTGHPNVEGLPAFPVYGAEARVLVMNETGFSTALDAVVDSRCEYWQKALYS